jgi:hypothetical protein
MDRISKCRGAQGSTTATLAVNSKNVSEFLDDLHIKNHGVIIIE